MKFKLLEDNTIPDMNKISNLILNEEYFPAYIVRNYFNENQCQRLKEGFLEVVENTQGGNRRNAFVPVIQIGATQFTKSTKDYFDECADTNENIESIKDSFSTLEDRNDILLENSLNEFLKQKDIYFGPSTYNNQKVNSFTARKWINNDEILSLLPHEDLSQLKLALVDNYEIGTVKKVIASNLCISNSNGGELIVWKYVPSEEEKVKLGVDKSGYPYPLEMLEKYESLTIKINPGDLYFFNANYVHAVKEVNNSERITMGRFIGLCDDNKVVFWT